MNIEKQRIRQREQQTLSTLRQVNNNLFMLEYKGDYGLDSLLSVGADSVLSLMRFIQRRMKAPASPELSKIFPDEFACTAFSAVNGVSEPIMGRNFDGKDAPCIVVWTAPEGGLRSMATVSGGDLFYGKNSLPPSSRRPLRLMAAPYACVDGINEAGLAGALLRVKAAPTRMATGRTPIVPTAALRAALDKCAGVEEVISLFEGFDMQDPKGYCSHFLFCGFDGCAVIEYADDEMHVIRPAEHDQSLVLTNYFLTEDADNTYGSGYERHRAVSSALRAVHGIMYEDDAMSLLAKNTLYYKDSPLSSAVATVWSSVFNLSDRTQLTCTGRDYSNAFRFAVSRPCKFDRIPL